jgi:hypothetical protein
VNVGTTAVLAATRPGKDQEVGVAVFFDGKKHILIDKTIRSFFYCRPFLKKKSGMNESTVIETGLMKGFLFRRGRPETSSERVLRSYNR